MNDERIKSTPLVSREQVSQYMQTGSLGRNDFSREGDLNNGIRTFGNVPEHFTLDKVFSKKVVAYIIGASLFAGLVNIPFAISQEKAIKDAEEIVYTAEVPDEFDGSLNMKVIVQANGEAYFESEDGIKSKKLDDQTPEHVAKITGYEGELSAVEGRVR